MRNTSKRGCAAAHYYEVCLSFAGEDRSYVRELADDLKLRGVRIFYDEYESVNMWGRDLYEHLDQIYRHAARFCVIFISDSYARKLWTNHERKSAQARSFEENEHYILPVRFDDIEIPGIRPTLGYIDARHVSPLELSQMIVDKLAPYRRIEVQERKNFFPDNPDILFSAMKARSKKAKTLISYGGRAFLDSIRLMSEDEKYIVYEIFMNTCPAELPENVHVNFDLLRRISGWSAGKIRKTLSNLKALHFDVRLPADVSSYDASISVDDHASMVYLSFSVWSDFLDSFGNICDDSNFTGVINSMVNIVGRYSCEEHCLSALMSGNFSTLSTDAAIDDVSR